MSVSVSGESECARECVSVGMGMSVSVAVSMQVGVCEPVGVDGA